MTSSNRCLIAGGAMSALISLLHVLLAVYPALYRFIGPDGSSLTEMAARGSGITTLVSVSLAFLFAIWALYAFSGAGLIHPLPLLQIVLVAITVIYLLRSLFLLSEIGMVSNQGYPFRFVVFSAISLTAGLLYLIGILRRRSVSTRRG